MTHGLNKNKKKVGPDVGLYNKDEGFQRRVAGDTSHT
jgi:hypothetical protein